MAELVTDPADPRLGRGVDDTPGQQNEAYLVLSEEERLKGFVGNRLGDVDVLTVVISQIDLLQAVELGLGQR
jgi:hypothetical protein